MWGLHTDLCLPPFFKSLISVNIWHPPSTHYTHFVNHSPSIQSCSFRLKGWMLQRQDTADTENKNYYFSVQQGAHLFCRRCMFSPELKITLPSFCFCVFVFFCFNVMPYYWCNPLLASVQNTGSKDIMSGCRVWVHCCDQPLCLLSKRLSPWRWYHWKKNPFDGLSSFCSCSETPPATCLSPVRRRLVSLLDVLKFYCRSGCLLGNISSWISRYRPFTWLVIKKSAEVNHVMLRNLHTWHHNFSVLKVCF